MVLYLYRIIFRKTNLCRGRQELDQHTVRNYDIYENIYFNMLRSCPAPAISCFAMGREMNEFKILLFLAQITMGSDRSALFHTGARDAYG